MPVPPGLLMDIAILIVREYRRSRKRRAAPGVARAPAPSRAPARRLSSVGRALRLAAIVGLLWLLWREVTRRRAALIEAQRDAFSRTASMTAVLPAPSLPPAPPAPPADPPASAPGDADSSVSPVDSAEHARSKTSAENLASPEHAAPEDATADEERGNGALIGWCARCRVRQPMQRVTFETNAGGRSIARGVCPVCGAGITRFVAREARKIEG
ncbi:DUF5679 domain-containing protein [Roseiflexus castenholzii]|nr:DUF5679 domain-containing protein [Roseiflexus castenholzii]